MSEIDKLLEGVEVEWKTLGEVVKIVKGKQLNKELLTDDGLYPAYNGGTSFSGFTNVYNYNENNTIISQGGASAGFVNFVKTKFFANAHCYVILPNIEIVEIRFIYHFLKQKQEMLMSKQHGAGIPALRTSEISEILIPIPPLSVQKEIVGILDKMTEHTAQLTAELTARKKQYNFYRDQLLRFQEGEVEWKTLGMVGEVRMCKRILKEQTTDVGDIPFYKIGTFGKEPNAYISKKTFEEYKSKYNYPKLGEVLISASGTIGRTVIFDGIDAYFQDSNIVWIENDEKQVLNKYLFYFYQIAKWEIADGGTIQRLYNDNLKKTKIPIPSLKQQERIVTILDKFDMLTTSISEGLPKEIELRKKQYEYYRDMLLTFPKHEN
jgi:type I restriction enzyme S subunit